MHWDLGHFFAALMGGLRRALRQPYSHALPPPPPPRRRRLRPEVNFLGFPRAIDFQTAEPGSGLEGLKIVLGVLQLTWHADARADDPARSVVVDRHAFRS